jgi:hypothetical protein
MKDSVYHKSLRTGAVIVALVLVFDGGFLNPVSGSLSSGTWQYLANSVGVFAGVESTQISELTAELTLREQELAAREAALREREITAREFGSGSDYSVYVLSTILFILTVLIVLNYTLDFTRARKNHYAQKPA